MKMPRVLSGRRRRILARLVAIALGQAAAALALGWLVRGIVDSEASTGLRRHGLGLGIALLLVIAVGLLRRWERVEAERMAQSYVHRLRRALFERLCRSDVGELQRVHRGALLLRFIGDLASIGDWVSAGVARLSVTTIAAGLTLVILATYDLRATALVAILLAVGLGTAVILARGLNAAMAHARRRRARLAANLAEKAQGFHVVNAFAQGRREGRRLKRQSAAVKSAMIDRARRAGAIDAVADATAALVIVAVLAFGALEHAAGLVSAGAVAACVAIVAQLAGPIRDVAHVYERWCSYRLSRDKIRAFLAGGSRRPRKRADIGGAAAGLELRDVSVNGRLLSASLDVRAGSRIAVWGPTGGGKTTLLAVLGGLLRPDSGSVRIADRNLDGLSASDLHRAVGLYGADLGLLRGTILRNLRYRSSRATPADVDLACRQFGVDELLARRPDGLRARLTDHGGNLSLGERQRLALVRAWVGRPPILLLDDLDAIADALLRAQVRTAIAAYPGTVVMVTQQSDLLALADNVWRVARGELTRTRPAARAEDAEMLIAQAVTEVRPS